ncbi:hypothetical protein [Microcoleus sp. CAWBG58]|uniref:hypothetical protein n=1 Tax=Microcoleus sp. CAWBG58 TaxID=2841651 RepID=UPI0025E66B7D|nr:hypothetical protein [Microcoleus sp. CAWBG58]
MIAAISAEPQTKFLGDRQTALNCNIQLLILDFPSPTVNGQRSTQRAGPHHPLPLQLSTAGAQITS